MLQKVNKQVYYKLLSGIENVDAHWLMSLYTLINKDMQQQAQQQKEQYDAFQRMDKL